MKKLSKPFISIFLTIVMIITAIPMSAFAANYSVNYWEHSEPTRQLYYNGGSQMYGDDVKWFQCAINNLVMNGDINNSQLNTPKLDVDGYFGNASKKALLDFQTKYSLAVDGYFGPDSRAKMKSMLRSGSSSSSSSSSSSTPKPSYEPVEHLIHEGVYYIRNKKSNKYMDVESGGTHNGANIIQYTLHGGANQQFRIKYEGESIGYKITPMNCQSKCFDLSSQSAANTNGTDLMIYDASNSYIEQSFRLTPVMDERGCVSVEIGSVASNGQKVLEVTDSSIDNCAIIQLWERSDSRDNDNWILERVDRQQPNLPDKFEAGNSTYPLGSICYDGYRYKIVTEDDEIPANGFIVEHKLSERNNFFDWSEFVSLELEGEDYHSAGVVATGFALQTLSALINAHDTTDIVVTLYRSQAGIRYATIRIYDSAVMDLMYQKAGKTLASVEMEDGRRMQMHFDEQHIKGNDRFIYNGYINRNGAFCIAFRGYNDDYITISETSGWNSKWNLVPWYGYGYDMKHKTPFEAMQADSGYTALLNRCLKQTPQKDVFFTKSFVL